MIFLSPGFARVGLSTKSALGFFVCYGQRWGEAVSPAFPCSGTGKVDKGGDVRSRLTSSFTLSLLNRQ